MIKITASLQWTLPFVILLTLASCATLPQNTERQASTAFMETQETTLGRLINEAQEGYGEKSAYVLLGDGLDAFGTRISLADLAEKSIDAQYYLIHNDLVGKLFIARLYSAADRGVRIRLLVDDIDLEGRDFDAAVMDSHPKIEVRIFNPFSRKAGRTSQYITGFGKQTRRAHNKSFTVDNQVTILGGRNIGDEYFDADPDLSFLDLDVLILGHIAEEVSSSFDQYWNSELSYPVSLLVNNMPTPEEIIIRKDEFDSNLSQQGNTEYINNLSRFNMMDRLSQEQFELHWAKGEVVADEPEKLTHAVSRKTYRLSEKLVPYLEKVKSELIIYSPYFVPGEAGLAFFRQMIDQGVQIKILTNSLASTDVGIVHSGYAKYRKDLLRMGVQLYELDKNFFLETKDSSKYEKIQSSISSLHAKCFILDRSVLFIGSLNLDPRSLKQNTEIGVVFNSEAIAGYLADDFDNQIEDASFRLELIKQSDGVERLRWHGKVNGKRVVFTHDPYTGFWKRFGVGLMGLLPIESQI